MKTAISIPDTLFRKADRLAKRLKLSRSELYARAVERFVRDHDSADLTARINKALEGEDSSLDPVLERLQAETWAREEW